MESKWFDRASITQLTESYYTFDVSARNKGLCPHSDNHQLRWWMCSFIKSHLSLISPLLLSKPDPLALGFGLGPPLRGGFVLSREDIDFNCLIKKKHLHSRCFFFRFYLTVTGAKYSVSQVTGTPSFNSSVSMVQVISSPVSRCPQWIDS